MSKKNCSDPTWKKVWKMLGGRKFIGLVAAIIITYIMGHLDTNLMAVFIAFMTANAIGDAIKVNIGGSNSRGVNEE